MTTRRAAGRRLLWNPRSFLAALSFLVACSGMAGAPGATGGVGPDGERDSIPAVVLRVDNQTRFPVNLYALFGAERRRLGTIKNYRVSTLPIPEAVIRLGSSISFVADPIGAGFIHRSIDVVLRPGDTATWTLHSNPAFSNLSTRSR